MMYANLLFKQDGGYSLQASAREYQYESSSQTESKKGYSLLYPSFCFSCSKNKRRAMASSFARPFPNLKPFLFA